MLSIISKTNSIDTSYIIFRDNKLFLHILSLHLFNSISRFLRWKIQKQREAKKKGSGRNKTTHNAQTQAILFLSTLRKRYCSTRTTRLERSEVFQIDRNLIPFEQNFHSITVSLLYKIFTATNSIDFE